MANFQLFPSTSIKTPGQLPEAIAVYFVVAGDNLLYIGQASNLRNAIRNNPKTKDFQQYRATDIYYITCDSDAEAKAIKQQQIQKHQPQLNVTPKDNSANIPTFDSPESCFQYAVQVQRQYNQAKDILDKLRGTLTTYVVQVGGMYREQDVTISQVSSDVWEYSESVANLEQKIKDLQSQLKVAKKIEQKSGIASILTTKVTTKICLK